MIGPRPRSALSRRLALLAEESRVSPNLGVTRRLHLLSRSRVLILQLCVACSVAWLIASALLDHPQPFFAPIAAVIALAGGAGQRRRAVLELVVGVAIGIAVGELILSVIGRGAWQLFLVVGLAAALAVVSGLGRMALLQAVNSAVLISVVIPTAGGSGSAAANRFVDALVGGLVGLAVTALLPVNPVRQVEQEVSEVLSRLAGVLQLLSTSLRFGDPGPAWTALHEARAMEPQVQSLTEVLSTASEVSRVAPLRWNQRDHLGLYVSTWRYVDHAVRDARVLARRVETLLRRSVPPPVGLDAALEDLAHAVRIFASDLSEQDRFDEAVTLLVETARAATIGLDPQAPLSAVAAVAQVRSLAADLLYATGLGSRDVDELFKTSTDAELDEEPP
ncbi:MAG: FUSC family protein [Actinomycetota bacterium]|nr:FUSC family protein [Actinomycetota bacterium]